MHSIILQQIYGVVVPYDFVKESKRVGGDNNAKERKGYEGVNCQGERLNCTSKESKQKGGLVKGVWEGCACFIFT